MAEHLLEDILGLHVIRRIERLDWDDLATLSEESRRILTELSSDRGLMKPIVETARYDRKLLSISELLPDMYKLTLYEDQTTKARLRLHIYRPGYEDVPHSHRWTLASLLLTGEIHCRYYGTDAEYLAADGHTSPASLLTKFMTAGSFYTMHHSIIHHFRAKPHSVTFCLRGPTVKDRSIKILPQAVDWKYGTQQESSSAQITPQAFDDAMAILQEAEII